MMNCILKKLTNDFSSNFKTDMNQKLNKTSSFHCWPLIRNVILLGMWHAHRTSLTYCFMCCTQYTHLSRPS